METGKFVEALDKLNKLKDEGIIDANEYENQVNKLKKQYSNQSNNYYKRNPNHNTNATEQNNIIAFLFLLIILIICGIWFFSSNVFKDLTIASKSFINDLENYTSFGSSYNYNTSTTDSGTSISGTIGSSSNINNSNSKANTQTQTESRKTYNVNVRSTQKDNFGVEQCALTVMNYQTETYNSEVGGVKDGQEWVIVKMKFENMSNSTIVLDKSDFKIVDGAGRYGYNAYYKHLDTELSTLEVKAGQTATFSVRFVYYKNNEMILRFNHPAIVTEVYTDIKLR